MGTATSTFASDDAAFGVVLAATTFAEDALATGFAAGLEVMRDAAFAFVAATAILAFCCAEFAFGNMPSSISELTHEFDNFGRLARMHAWHPADPAVCIEQ